MQTQTSSLLEVMGTRWGELSARDASLSVSGAQDLGQRQRQFRTGFQRLVTLDVDFKDLPLVLRTGMAQDDSGLVDGIHHTSVSKKLWFRGPKFDPDWEEDVEAVRTESCRHLQRQVIVPSVWLRLAGGKGGTSRTFSLWSLG